MKTRLTFAFATILLLATAMIWCASPASAQIDALCTASITLNFDPPARLVLPPTPAPHSTATGSGTITTCTLFDGGPTTGTFTYSLEGDLTCTSAENIFGTVDIVWADNTESYADITTLVLDLGSVGGAAGLIATVTSGRFAGDPAADHQPARSPGLDPLRADRPVAGEGDHDPHLHAAALMKSSCGKAERLET